MHMYMYMYVHVPLPVGQVEEMALHPKWDHRLRMNRGQYDQTLVAMTTPVAYDMCMAVMRMEHNVAYVLGSLYFVLYMHTYRCTP